MIDFEEDPDPRERRHALEEPGRPAKRPSGPLAIPAIRTMFEDLFHPDWDEEYLWRCQRDWLVHLCRLLGASVSGTIEQLITRLLAVLAVHKKLHPFSPHEWRPVATRFNKQELKWMAREAGIPRSLNKDVTAFILILWRDATRLAGQEYLAALGNSHALRSWTPPRKRIQDVIRRIYARMEHNRMQKVISNSEIEVRKPE